MAIVTRPIRKKDAGEIIKLYRAFEAYLQSLGDKPSLKFTKAAFLRDGFGNDRCFVGWVALDNKKIIGYLLGNLVYEVDEARRVFFVADLFVNTKHRHKGAGRLLMQNAAAYAKSRRASCMTWDVFKSNNAAFRFYRNLGARKASYLKVMFLEGRFFEQLTTCN